MGDVIRPGTLLRARDAMGVWHEVQAISSPQQGHKFPIVWVLFTTKGEPAPWPLDAVEMVTPSDEGSE